ncbi:MAG TPA: KH domain-containing protein [Verrucomicrobiae bacterium]|nr:KH domain-containing protein [Verrucomicrobiae bacterium]
METQPVSVTPTAPSSANPREVLQKMLDSLDVQTKVEQFTMDGSTLLHIATVEPGRLIGKHGQTLNELQFLLNRMLQRMDKTAPPVIVDCERYRERQRDELLRQVVVAADRVRRWGDPVKIGPFSAFDRRIIHMHMQRDMELEAVSEDEEAGGRKKMIIRVRQKSAT